MFVDGLFLCIAFHYLQLHNKIFYCVFNMLAQEGRKHHHTYDKYNKHMFDLLGIERPLIKKPPKTYALVQMPPLPFPPPLNMPVIPPPPFGMMPIVSPTFLPGWFGGNNSQNIQQSTIVTSDLVVEDSTHQQTYKNQYVKNKQLYKNLLSQ